MPAINEKFKGWYSSLSPKKRRSVIVGGLAVLLLVVGLIGYRGRSTEPVRDTGAAISKKDISLDPKLIEKTQLAEARRTSEEQDKQMKALQQDLENLKKQRPEQKTALPQERARPGAASTVDAGRMTEQQIDTPQAGQGMPKAAQGALLKNYPYPPPPLPGNLMTDNKNHTAVNPAGGNVVGDIEIVSNTAVDGLVSPSPAPDDKKKDQGMKVYLPPSFMEGTLLSGLDAPVVESARKDPMPVLIRINDLAVLPNEVKANLRGCFVIAHGYGNLASERAEIKLVSLSCLSKKGDAIIDQPVTGYVVDADGKVGLAGKVVAKLGALLARSALAGFMQGVGDFLKASTTTTQVTGAGTIQTIDTNKLVSAGVGGGISNAAGDLAKFYNELARMSMPVIEVGATKKITVIVSEGVDLAIKEKKMVEE